MRRLTYVLNEAGHTGAPKSALQVLHQVDSRSAEISVVLLRGGPLVPEFERVADQVVLEPNGPMYPWLQRARFRGGCMVCPPERAVARRWLDELRPDTLIADTVVSGAWAVEATNRAVTTGLIVRENEPSLRCFLRATRLTRSLPALTSIAVNSAATSRQLGKYSHGPAPHLLPPTIDWLAIDEVRQRGAHRPRVVVACGSVGRIKGADRFPQIIQLVNDCSAEPAVGRWIGDGPLRARLSRKTRGSNTNFIGPRPSALEELAAAQVCIIPSRAEPLSRVALEASALGTPVVAFDVGGLRESLGPRGLLVPEGDIDTMAECVAGLLADESWRAAVGRSGRQHAAQAFNHKVVSEAARVFLRDLSVPVKS